MMKSGTKIAIAMAICFCVIAMSVGGYYASTSQAKKDEPGTSTADDPEATTPEATTPSAPAATTPSAPAATTPSAPAATPVVNTSSDDLTPVITPVSSGLLDSDSEDDDSGDLAPVATEDTPTPTPVKSDADKLMDAFLEGGTGKFNKHLPGYCRNWRKKDQNSGDINYGKKTVAECKKICFDKGPDGSDELTACEWGKGDINSTTDKAGCIGHTRDINRFAGSGHDNRMCWTTAAPEDYDDTNEKLYGKR